MKRSVQLLSHDGSQLSGRRIFLRHAAWGVVAVPVVQACGGSSNGLSDAGSNGSDAATRAVDSGFGMSADSGLSSGADSGLSSIASDSGMTNADAATTNDDAAASQSEDAGSDAGTVAGWATGGTSSMTAKASYPDPFVSAVSMCSLVATTTEGPCTTATDRVREDVSENWSGLPVRLALKVVDSSCNALSNVDVKIWHTNLAGSYSGMTPNNRMCLSMDSYANQDFFRGVQTTDDDGNVFFDTCFPGWYRGRAIHIHFQVKNGNTSYRVSQLAFPEEINQDIFANHPEYSGFGQPDTSVGSDNIFGRLNNTERDELTLAVERMRDGAMLASKVIAVR